MIIIIIYFLRIIYPLLHVKFRKAFRKIICFWKKRKGFKSNSNRNENINGGKKSELRNLINSKLSEKAIK